MTSPNSFYELFANGVDAPYTRSLTMAGKNAITLATTEQPAGVHPDPAMPEFSLQLKLRGNSALTFGYGGKRSKHLLNPGTFCLSPPDVDGYYELDKPFRLGLIAFPKRAFERFAAQSETPLGSDFGRLHDSPFHDTFLEQLFNRMILEAEQGGISGELFVDSALNTILSILLRLSDRARHDGKSKYALSPHQLNQVLELMEVRLAENINLDELSTITELSESHFIKAFKVSTGETPYQYLLKQRLQKAQRLLQESKQSLVEITYACGFSSQQHMTSVFSKRLGMTPAQYRREVKS